MQVLAFFTRKEKLPYQHNGQLIYFRDCFYTSLNDIITTDHKGFYKLIISKDQETYIKSFYDPNTEHLKLDLEKLKNMFPEKTVENSNGVNIIPSYFDVYPSKQIIDATLFGNRIVDGGYLIKYNKTVEVD